MRTPLAALLLAAAGPALAAGTALDDHLVTLRGVEPAATNQRDVAIAWKAVSQSPPDALPTIIAAFDGATPLATNTIRPAADAVVERAVRQKQPLPLAALITHLGDRRHSYVGRRYAYEILLAHDPAVAAQFLPTFETDPAPELRYDAIQAAFDAAKGKAKDDAAAKATFQRLLANARDITQIEAVAKQLEDRGVPVDLTAHLGFLTRWHVLAPFKGKSPGFNVTYPPEEGFDLTGTVADPAGKPLAWKPVASKEKYGVVDLNKLIGVEKNSVAYAVAEFDSPAERRAELRAASATAVKLWLNGKEVLAREAYHQSFEADMYVAPVTLAAGRNVILAKVCQNAQTQPWAQNWQFQVRVSDRDGKAYPVTQPPLPAATPPAAPPKEEPK